MRGLLVAAMMAIACFPFNLSAQRAGQGAGKGWFKTPPAGAEPYTFTVYGDTRTRHDVHRRVVDALLVRAGPSLTNDRSFALGQESPVPDRGTLPNGTVASGRESI